MLRLLRTSNKLIAYIALTLLCHLKLVRNSDHTKLVADRLYCDRSLCLRFNGTHMVQRPHIGCRNEGHFGPDCGSQPHLVQMGERRRSLILDMHNLARSRIAAGQIAGYPSASQMPLLQWNTELEYLAELHVKACRFDHDECHNTARFRYSGQNIGYFWIDRQFMSHSKRMKSFISHWFQEYKNANETFIKRFSRHPEGKLIEHFTMMVSDRARFVGCAAVRHRDPVEVSIFKLLMTCNYDFNNLLGEPVYRIGSPASKCAPYKSSKKFPALCDATTIKAAESNL